MTALVSLQPNANIGNASMPDGSEVILDMLIAQDCKLHFPTLPNVQFTLQGIQLPSISVNSVKQFTKYVDPNQIGEKLNFENLYVTFVVDKAFRNWASIFDWMKRMTVSGSHIGETDNPTVIINGQETLQFIGAWPTRLDGIQFDATIQEAQYVKATLSLNYDYVNYVGQYKTVNSTYDRNQEIGTGKQTG